MASMGPVGLSLFLFAVIAASVLLDVGSISVARCAVKESAFQKYSSALAPFVTTVALVYGSMLSFTVVIAWEQFTAAESNINSESSTLVTMYRQTVAMPDPEQTKLRELLRTYTSAVESEWNWQDDSDTSATARAAITQMYRVLGSQTPDAASNPINGEFLSQLTVLAKERNTRVLDATPRIPGLMWAGLLFGAALLIAIMGFTRLDSQLGHMVLSSGVAILLGLLLFIVFWLDHPFGRQLGLTPAPFAHALEVFDGVDRGR